MFTDLAAELNRLHHADLLREAARHRRAAALRASRRVLPRRRAADR